MPRPTSAISINVTSSANDSLNAKRFNLEFIIQAARLLVESLDGQVEKASGLGDHLRAA
jgi:hypothetical protein